MSSPAFLYRPTHTEQIAELFSMAGQKDTPITFRGSGRSYGDAALNAGGIVIDIRRMNRILDWDPETGVIVLQPGVTIEQLWKFTLEDGWWPSVVPGTMHPTMGGCLGANIHGKNNWQRGTIGEQVLSISALLPNGELVHCKPEDELFTSLISSFGMLGFITEITMQMKRIHSGNLWVGAWAEPDLAHMLAATDDGKDEFDYIVGWIDCTARGSALGRGQMHTADYFQADEDPAPFQTLQTDYQTVPSTMFGVVPKSVIHKFMTPFLNNLGVRLINSTKYLANRTIGNHKRFPQSLIAFNFLLDYVPDWERAYGKGGLIQYQCFIPKETAQDAFTEIIQRGIRHKLPNYLGVLKRHRPDPFLFSHAVDGFSLAQDYRVTHKNRVGLEKLLSELDEIIMEAGGRFYFAKDSTLQPDAVRAFLGEDTLQKFAKLKKELDPAGILESDLYRRCFQELVPK